MVTLFQCYIRQWRPSTLEIPTYPMIRLLGFIGSSRKTLPSFMHVLHAKWRRPYDVAWKQGASNAGMPANLLLTDAQLEYMVIIWSFVLPHFSAYLRHWPRLIDIHWSMLKFGELLNWKAVGNGKEIAWATLKHQSSLLKASIKLNFIVCSKLSLSIFRSWGFYDLIPRRSLT